MDPNRDKLAKEIFASALEIEDATARARYLAEACGADAALRQEVESLLQAHGQAGNFLQPKPTNVLVALYDGKPVPKVIDFGVAKAMGQRLTERT